MARKTGLGKGLDALIPSDMPSQVEGPTNFVSVHKIIPNPRQPRHKMNREDLEELAVSIKENGILQPLLVSYDPSSDIYVLIAGERRLQAACLAGLDTVPVLERQATEQERLELALIENVQRADLTPLETAEAYRQLNEEFNLSHEDIASRVGKSRVAITNTMRLLKLPDAVQEALAQSKITEGHARALLGLPTPQSQRATLDTILSKGFNVRKTEELVRQLIGEKPKQVTKPSQTPEVQAIEERLRAILGTKVTLRHGSHGGNIIIHYYSDEELDAIITKLINQ